MVIQKIEIIDCGDNDYYNLKVNGKNCGDYYGVKGCMRHIEKYVMGVGDQ